MREVVKKEVLKLLHAGIIYPVPNSEWVSPMQVVPKKGGMTHYYRLGNHHRHFHCHKYISDSAIVPPPVGSIARPGKESNWKMKLLAPMVEPSMRWC